MGQSQMFESFYSVAAGRRSRCPTLRSRNSAMPTGPWRVKR